MIIPRSDATQIQYDELATLKKLAQQGALGNEIEISLANIAADLEVSTQTVSRRLRELADAELIDRTRTNEGQRIALLPAGIETLRDEYEEYQAIFTPVPEVTLTGEVTSGMGRGRHFIQLEGYNEQFKDKLGYSPYPGTFNVELDDDSLPSRSLLALVPSIQIEEWETDDTTYGSAVCYPVTITESTESTSADAHILIPDRTDHTTSQLELIAAHHLREELGVSDGDEVKVYVET
jgi:riboflavin kinase